MKDIGFMTRQILGFRLENTKDPAAEAALIQQFLAFGSIYVVADPDTRDEDWSAKSFGIHTEGEAIRLYADKNAAELKATTIGSVLSDGTPMVMKISSNMAKSLVADYAQKNFIHRIWLCGRAPIAVNVGIIPIVKEIHRESPSTIMTETVSEPIEAMICDEDPSKALISAPEPFSKNPPTKCTISGYSLPNTADLLLIDEIKKTLDMPAASDRRQLDPGDNYTNLSKMLEKVIQKNGIDMQVLDQKLGLQPGFTKHLCGNQTSDKTPKKIVIDYLSYFGLSKYLYVYKKQCEEVAQELNQHPNGIDLYTIQKTTPKTVERFTLEAVSRAIYKNEAYIYQLKFTSNMRTVTALSSSNFGMIVGKEYELIGLTPVDGTHDPLPKNAATMSHPVPGATADEEAAILEALEKKERERKHSEPSQRQLNPDQAEQARRGTGKYRFMETEEQKKEKELSTILSYIIKTEGCNVQEARRKMVPIEDHDKTVASFAKYIETGKGGAYSERGWTPKKLMLELRFSPYEAFCVMADLEDKPKETLQMLKYRQTDPQYQRNPQKGKKEN